MQLLCGRVRHAHGWLRQVWVLGVLCAGLLEGMLGGVKGTGAWEGVSGRGTWLVG